MSPRMWIRFLFAQSAVEFPAVNPAHRRVSFRSALCPPVVDFVFNLNLI